MILRIAHTVLLVADYDEAISFYCGKLGFHVVEDTQWSAGAKLEPDNLKKLQ